MSKWFDRTSYIFSILGVAIVAMLGWSTWVANIRLWRENAILKNAAQTPFMIRNLELDLAPFLMPVPSQPSSPQLPSHGLKVILTASDTCTYCEQQVPLWKTAFDRLAERKDSEVWLISISEVQGFKDLPQSLRNQHIQFREFKVKSPLLFGLCTGLRATPATIVTFNDRVILAQTGVYSPDIVRSIRGVLEDPGMLQMRFLPPGLSSYLL